MFISNFHHSLIYMFSVLFSVLESLYHYLRLYSFLMPLAIAQAHLQLFLDAIIYRHNVLQAQDYFLLLYPSLFLYITYNSAKRYFPCLKYIHAYVSRYVGSSGFSLMVLALIFSANERSPPVCAK